MTFTLRIAAFIAVFTLSSIFASGQGKPIGYWESLLPYNIGVGLVTDGNTMFSLCPQSFFSYNPADNGIETYAKENGMADNGMQCGAYDAATKTLVLAYANSNIDLFKNNTFYNIPDLKIKSIAGNKTITQVYTENGTAYVCTAVGILVIDLTSHNITENIQFILNNQTLPVNSFTGLGTYFYAATSAGLYRASKNDPQLQNFEDWQRLDSVDVFTSIASVNNTLFMATARSVFGLVNDTVQVLYTCEDTSTSPTHHDTLIQHIDPGYNQLYISEFHPEDYNGDVRVMNTSFAITDTISGIGKPVQVVQRLDSTVWVADAYYGLEKMLGNNFAEKHNPPGPSDPNSFDIFAYNKDVWIAHGGFDDKYAATGDLNGVSNLNNGKWTAYLRYVYQPFDTLTNFVAVLKDENTGTVYMGSYLDGLFILNKDGSYQLIKQNSFFDLGPYYANAGQRQIAGLAFDSYDNLWVTAVAQPHQLYVKTAADSTWYSFTAAAGNLGGPLLIDDNGYAWFCSDVKNGGLTVYNANNTFNTTSDDATYHLTTGTGTGNLPSNNVFCIAKDKNNQVWVGTDNGIGIISGCQVSSSASPTGCDADIPIVQYDQFAGYLFAGNNVRTIAVDGANRKWVGTDQGVWLLSADASQIVYRFTQDNSPLPSDLIQKITVDKVTGDVYIGTASGLVSYRSTATDGGTSNQDVLAFPNPVKSGYTGTIAIKGLVANADVRITDIDGELVYKTTALGGQAVWNGLDYTGRRPQSGVYLIFVSSSDGSQTYTGKIVFMK